MITAAPGIRFSACLLLAGNGVFGLILEGQWRSPMDGLSEQDGLVWLMKQFAGQASQPDRQPALRFGALDADGELRELAAGVLLEQTGPDCGFVLHRGTAPQDECVLFSYPGVQRDPKRHSRFTIKACRANVLGFQIEAGDVPGPAEGKP